MGRPGVSGCLPGRRGRQERPLWSGAARAGASVPGAPALRAGLGGLVLKRPGLSSARGPEGRIKRESFPRGIPHSGDPHFRGGKRWSRLTLSFLLLPVSRGSSADSSLLCRLYWRRDLHPCRGRGGLAPPSVHKLPLPQPPAGCGREMAAVRLLLRLLF